MLNTGMAKNPNRCPPVPAAPVAKRKRGRPPSPNGPTSLAEIQRAYRARLAAAGKVVRAADAAALTGPDGVSFAAPRGSFYVPAPGRLAYFEQIAR
jgi:hypothetical protein